MLTDTELLNAKGIAVVIEDDLDIRNLVCAVLRRAGFGVHPAATGRDGVEAVRTHAPTVVTLDVGLPDIDGYEALRRIRDISDCYVLMLTGRSEEADALTALQSGADDYLTKPFRPRELRARIDAVLRRPRAGPPLPARNPSPATPTSVPAPAPAPAYTPAAAPESAPSARKPRVSSRGELVLDRDARAVWVANQEVPVTKSEFDLLNELLQCNGAIRTRSALVGVLRGEDYRGYSYVSDADQRAVEVHVTNLRRKLSQHAGAAELIMTVRGVGYRIAPVPAPEP